MKRRHIIFKDTNANITNVYSFITTDTDKYSAIQLYKDENRLHKLVNSGKIRYPLMSLTYEINNDLVSTMDICEN